MRTATAKRARHTTDKAGVPSTRYFTTSKLSENIHETPEGFLVCIGVPIARTGDLVYGKGESPLDVGDDGRVIVSRNADVVFSPETITSFEGKALTIQHPTDFLSPTNWAQLAKGIMQNVRRGTGSHENDLLVDLLITDSHAIALVKAGLREVSCGYDAWYVQTGIGRGVQTKIIGNHLALVEEGRAGAGYAITDHKGKGSTMKLRDRIKAIFAKAQDEALKVAEEAGEDEELDEGGEPTNDVVMKAIAKLDAKITAIGKKSKTKDLTTAPTQNQPAKVEAKDDEEMMGGTGLEDRMKKLEAAVAAILEKISAGASDEESDVETSDADEDGEEAEDSDEDGEEETGDCGMTGDGKGPEDEEDENEEEFASRVEILAPGMSTQGKGVKGKALLAAYGTKDGRAVIEQLTGGKKPNLKDAKFVDMAFVAASEVLKTKRTKDFARTKTTDFQSHLGTPKGALSPEEMNKKNAEHYKH